MNDTVVALSDRMERLQRERSEAQADLVWLADHDPLTQLLNRRRFNKVFTSLVERSVEPGGRGGALLFFDLDQFKDVNDTGGHLVGDSLLRAIAERLRDLTSPACHLGRLGGDEFGLVLAEADLAQATALAEQVQARIESVTVEHRDLLFRISASIGIVLFPQAGADPQQLLADADLAMYRAKEKGRRRWYVFTPEDQDREQANARVRWSERVAAALADDRFELHFQPIMELATGSMRHVEALLRMHDEDGDLVYPDAFIPIAEKTGQIRAIDRWVLERSIATLAKVSWLLVSANLSASAMDDPSLLEHLKGLLRRHGVDPARLTIEITETVAIASLSDATRLMRSIQDLGCRFALDDFGSGFASYVYLRQLPVNTIKLDGSVIRNIARNREDRIFVKAMVEIVHGLNKQAVAEHVEDEETLRVLREIGVDYAQGYYIGRPAPIASPRSLADRAP